MINKIVQVKQWRCVSLIASKMTFSTDFLKTSITEQFLFFIIQLFLFYFLKTISGGSKVVHFVTLTTTDPIVLLPLWFNLTLAINAVK